MTNQKKTDYICISKESEGPAPDTLDETLPSKPLNTSLRDEILPEGLFRGSAKIIKIEDFV